MPLEYLIFDLDDTLCDYQSAKKNAIARINQELAQASINPTVFWTAYEKIESSLEAKLIDGAISWREYRERRFHDALKEMHDEPLALSERLDRIFMQEGNIDIKLFDDALPVISRLQAQGIMPAILTNGFSAGQRQKIRSLALDQHISHVYISEELGVSKPHHEIFDVALKYLGTEASKVLMVGDSIEHDFVGARQAGIRFVLIDRFDRHPDFEYEKIRNLTDMWHGPLAPAAEDGSAPAI